MLYVAAKDNIERCQVAYEIWNINKDDMSKENKYAFPQRHNGVKVLQSQNCPLNKHSKFSRDSGQSSFNLSSLQGPVVQKPVNVNLRLKVNPGFCFSC